MPLFLAAMGQEETWEGNVSARYAFRKSKDSIKKKAPKAERRLRQLEQERFEQRKAFPIVVTADALLQTYGQGQDQEVDCSSA
jgi:hypothetical protein